VATEDSVLLAAVDVAARDGYPARSGDTTAEALSEAGQERSRPVLDRCWHWGTGQVGRPMVPVIVCPFRRPILDLRSLTSWCA
jgi:hypothetical protein